MAKYYFLKTKGTDKIADYVQIRDNDYTLLAHFAAKNAEKGLKKVQIPELPENFHEQINQMPFGMVKEFEF